MFKNNLLDFVSDVRVISLPNGRRDEIQEHLIHRGLWSEKIIIKTANIYPKGEFESVGYSSNFQNHIASLESMIYASEDVLVLEDDTVFVKSDIDLTNIFSQCWDVLLLGGKGGPNEPGPLSAVLLRNTYQCHAYIVRNSKISKLINLANEVLERPEGSPRGGPMSFDGFLRDWASKSLVVMETSRNIAYQRSALNSRIRKSNTSSTTLKKVLSWYQGI